MMENKNTSTPSSRDPTAATNHDQDVSDGTHRSEERHLHSEGQECTKSTTKSSGAVNTESHRNNQQEVTVRGPRESNNTPSTNRTTKQRPPGTLQFLGNQSPGDKAVESENVLAIAAGAMTQPETSTQEGTLLPRPVTLETSLRPMRIEDMVTATDIPAPLQPPFPHRRQDPADPGAYSAGLNQSTRRTQNFQKNMFRPPSHRNPQPLPQTRTPVQVSTNPEGDLIVANAVSEAALEVTQVAQPQSKAANQNNGKYKNGKILLGAAVVCLSLLVGVVLLLVFLMKDHKSTEERAYPKVAPSMAPTSYLESYVLPWLPEETSAKLQDPFSPQARALEWILGDTANLPSFSAGRILQRFAMATLFFALDGYSWSYDDDWLEYDIHECLWGRPYGQYRNTFCDADRLLLAQDISREAWIKHMWVPSNEAQGTLPLEFFWLTNLTRIDLYGSVKGNIPSNIGHLTSLERIHLYGSELPSSMPTELGVLVNLSDLSLRYNGLTGQLPSELGQLSKLKYLGLDFNNLTGSIPTELGRMSALSHLDLAGNVGLSGRIPSELGLLTAMYILRIVGSSLSGAIPPELSRLEKLDSLLLTDNDLIGPIPTELGQLKAQSVALSNNSLSGTVPTEIGLLTNIRSLAFNYNSLSGTLPSHLGKLDHVKRLDLDANFFSGTIPTELGNLNNLQGLALQYNRLTGTIPAELGMLFLNGSLKELFVHQNYLTGTIPEEVCLVGNVISGMAQFCDCDCLNQEIAPENDTQYLAMGNTTSSTNANS